MKNFLILFIALFLPLTSLAASSGSGNVTSVISLGGVGSDTTGAMSVPAASITDDTFFTITTGGNITANSKNPFYKAFGVVASVPSTKKWYCVGPTYSANTANIGMQIVYGTATFSNNQSAALTGQANQTGANANFQYYVVTQNVPISRRDLIVFDNSGSTGVFPGIQVDTTGVYHVSFTCKEK